MNHFSGVLRLGDDSIKFDVDLDFSKILVPGVHMGGKPDQCYIGIFQSKEIEQDTWYLGNILMEDIYVVYDATPADEEG